MQKRSLLCAGALCLVLACNKKDYSPVPKGYPSIDSVYSEMGTKGQIVAVNAATGGSFYGKSGARYIFPPNAFMTEDGGAVTGDVSVEVAEYPNISDMIFSNVLTVSNGEPLISGGEVYVNPTQNGKKLSMAAIYQVNIPQKGKADSNMQYFYAKIDGNTKTKGVNWILDVAGTISVVSPDTLAVKTVNTGYGNADKYVRTTTIKNPADPSSAINNQTFTVRLSTVKGMTDNVTAFVVFDNYNTVFPITDVKNAAINVNNVPNIPVHFIVMTVVNGDFYGGISAATPMTGIFYDLNLNKTTPDDFRKAIDAIRN